MPGPTTELLNDDLKILGSDLKELGKDLGKSIRDVEVGQARLDAQFGFAKWLLGFLLVSTLSGIGSGIWWASGITKSVSIMETRFDKVESRLERLESRFEQFSTRFERQEAALTKLLEQTRPKP